MNNIQVGTDRSGSHCRPYRSHRESWPARPRWRRQHSIGSTDQNIIETLCNSGIKPDQPADNVGTTWRMEMPNENDDRTTFAEHFRRIFAEQLKAPPRRATKTINMRATKVNSKAAAIKQEDAKENKA